MPRFKTRHAPAELLADEFIQEKACALGRLGRALEASLAALAAFDAGRCQVSRLLNTGRCAPRLWRKRALRCGISWSNGRLAECATCATCSAITAYRTKCPRAWARLRESRCPFFAASYSMAGESAPPITVFGAPVI